ncbi:MAG TPA: GNAT family N-acetyltransferase, partial [Xanthobacteraceae bacterium]|nr:GNAT family N-acetyltransferase [Xanthobacteraceae bacterium]
IDYFAVFMGEQGNGYGSQLLAEAELRARDLGLKRLTIDFPASRFGGSFFEGREGWVRQGVRPKQFGGLEGNWEVWWRNLVDTR